MAITYEKIASSTTGDVATFTFSSIPSTYTDLKVIIQMMGGDSAGKVYMQYNNDTGSNYSWTQLVGNGTSASSSRGSSTDKISIAETVIPSAAHFGNNFLIDILNYSNTTTYKTNLTRGNAASSSSPGTTLFAGLWRSTSAITSIKFSFNFGQFMSGSTLSLYGIKAA